MYKKISASGIITRGPGVITGYLMGTDGVNDVSGFTIYNGTDNTGDEVIPTHQIEADNKGVNGAVGLRIDCPKGIYAEYTVAGGGAAELIIYWEPK